MSNYTLVTLMTERGHRVVLNKKHIVSIEEISKEDGLYNITTVNSYEYLVSQYKITELINLLC